MSESDKPKTGRDVASRKQRVVMLDLPHKDKQLILHAAIYAVKLNSWKHRVFAADIDKTVKNELIMKSICGDPNENLMRLAEKLLPEFNENKSFNELFEIIKKFVYGA